MISVSLCARMVFCRSSGVVSVLTVPTSALMRPSSDSAPVPTAIPVPLPTATKVPENAIAVRSLSRASGETGLADFPTGTDSPVSAASSIRRLRVRTRRKSAGTRSPGSSCTRSPGTMSSAATTFRRPLRMTEARGSIIELMASSARSARPSCKYPMIALSNTTTSTTNASTRLPIAAASAAAAIST